ncbi:MAG: EAL domain-containing protein [Candidatus Limnocylindrales bacterium]
MVRRNDVHRAAQAAELDARQTRFRLLADHAVDIVSRYRVSPTPGFEYVSPAVEKVLGVSPDAFYADPGLMAHLVHPDDHHLLAPQPGGPRVADAVVLRLRHAHGHWVWLEQRSTPVFDEQGLLVAVEGVARDVSDQQRAAANLARLNRVLRTRSAANQALVRAESEPALVTAICQTVVEAGGYRFAWVGYREIDDAGTVRPVAHAGHEAGYLADVAISWLDTERGLGPAGIAVREGRSVVSRDIATDPTMAPWRTQALARGYASAAAFPLRDTGVVFGTLVIYAAESDAFDDEEIALLGELADDLAYGIGALRSRQAAASAGAERRRLAAAIEQAGESVVITDTAGTIEYVNPTFERVTGYTREEAVGRNPRLLKSGLQSSAFYDAMWRTLIDGRVWVADFVNRRKDGSLFTEEAVISPVRDETGATVSYVAVKREVTAEREAEAREQLRARERALVAEALAALHPRATPEETAEAVCRQVTRLPEATTALLLTFDLDGRATPIGAAAADGRSILPRRLAVARTRHLQARALEGPWVESWTAERGHPFNRAFQELGVRALAYAPLRVDQDMVGLLELSSAEPDAADRLVERLPALVEFAAIAGAALGPSISSQAQLSHARERIRAIIEQAAFQPVFQPIVELADLEVVGYEALTRFADGTAPEELFREAAGLGLGTELELAALRAVLEAATALPPRPWLNVNLSPAVIVSGEPLRSIVAGFSGRLVLEVTEHQAITDYPAFRKAVAKLGPEVQIAVDDAGAGFASLRHILELRPQMVKIDRSLVAGIDSDPARQALLAGLRHFADSLGCSLIAEGIETQAELATLVSLEIPNGQGYLLGRPEPITQAHGAKNSATQTGAW